MGRGHRGRVLNIKYFPSDAIVPPLKLAILLKFLRDPVMPSRDSSSAAVVFEGKECKAMADQLSTVSKERLSGRAGVLSKKDMLKIEVAIKVQLGIH